FVAHPVIEFLPTILRLLRNADLAQGICDLTALILQHLNPEKLRDDLPGLRAFASHTSVLLNSCSP
ncbi:MAG: hypothetical protein AAF334_05140, partial [Pseudomonadota bacterium]